MSKRGPCPAVPTLARLNHIVMEGIDAFLEPQRREAITRLVALGEAARLSDVCADWSEWDEEFVNKHVRHSVLRTLILRQLETLAQLRAEHQAAWDETRALGRWYFADGEKGANDE